MLGIGANGELRLGAGFAVEGSGAQRAAVGAGAIPLGEASASGRAENLDPHARECSSEIFPGLGNITDWEDYSLDKGYCRA